ncbi:MAG: GTPase HflX [Dehalococcoidia bacterium]|nr:GTPase HflX [Dehalococcoidia bacterium]
MTVTVKGEPQDVSPEASQEELTQLAISAGARVVGKFIQHLPAPSHTFYIGKGKLEELKSLREKLDYSVVIFDDELLPLQQRNLEEALEVKVIDRVALILDIFSRRARTREGKLQVELAQHRYLLPRLTGQWSHLERLGGGIGTRGPGESQLETDRRLIRKRIQRLEDQLEKVRTQRLLYRRRRQRSGIQVVSLVGYTNTGKSTLMNALAQTGIASEDMPFTTLDPTTRRIRLPEGRAILLSDTVGFIRKLPPAIISAFRATLEELDDADLLLNIVDFSSPNAPQENQTVEDILKDLGLKDKPRITVLNKIDRLLDKDRNWTEQQALDFFLTTHPPTNLDTALVSALKKWGLSLLLQQITKKLASRDSSSLQTRV